MDVLIIGFSGFFILLGIAGSFLPIIPGPLTSWFGLFLLRFSSIVKIENRFLILCFCIALFIFLLDNIIPILGAKKFGGGRGSTVGSSIGIIIGILFLGPFGLIIGPFCGAFLGGTLRKSKQQKGGLKSCFWCVNRFLNRGLFKIINRLSLCLLFHKNTLGI